MMAEYVFYKIKEPALTKLNLQPTPFPIRKDMKEEIFVGDDVALDLLLDELDLFLEDHPEYKYQYQENIGRLSYLFGIQLGSEGYTKMAIHYLEIGLNANPENISLRANYAIALHSSGLKSEALTQYLNIINDPQTNISPIIWILAARILAEKGNYRKALELLCDCEIFLPREEVFWDFLAEMKDKVLREDQEMKQFKNEIKEQFVEIENKGYATPENANITLTCANCYQQIAPGAKFCKRCGAPVLLEAPQASYLNNCPMCRQPLKPDSKFCPQCGASVGQMAPAAQACPQCGKPLKAGSRFCGSCGFKLAS
jgi:tetratricopeptide (TPR) repeat protein